MHSSPSHFFLFPFDNYPSKGTSKVNFAPISPIISWLLTIPDPKKHVPCMGGSVVTHDLVVVSSRPPLHKHVRKVVGGFGKKFVLVLVTFPRSPCADVTKFAN